MAIELAETASTSEWLSIRDDPVTPGRPGERRRVTIRVSMDHPFMVRFRGADDGALEPLLRVAVALALGEVIARDAGVRFASEIRRHVNELLRDALAQP